MSNDAFKVGDWVDAADNQRQYLIVPCTPATVGEVISVRDGHDMVFVHFLDGSHFWAHKSSIKQIDVTEEKYQSLFSRCL